LSMYAAAAATGASIREGYAKAEADARQAVALAPDLAEAHVALAFVLATGALDFARASAEYDQAVALGPGSALVLRWSGEFGAWMGRFDPAIATLRRAVVLDPLARTSYVSLGSALREARRYDEAAAAYAAAISLSPDFKPAYGYRGLAFYGLEDFEKARASCEAKRDDWFNQQCLAVVYHKLGRHADAETELAKIKASQGDDAAYQYATIYAQWGDRAKALEWLEKAMRLRDPGMVQLKTDPLFDPLRQEARFQAIERALKYPD
jgi:tetratricopeptide (TPR) repeat protein